MKKKLQTKKKTNINFNVLVKNPKVAIIDMWDLVFKNLCKNRYLFTHIIIKTVA